MIVIQTYIQFYQSIIFTINLIDVKIFLNFKNVMILMCGSKSGKLGSDLDILLPPRPHDAYSEIVYNLKF